MLKICFAYLQYILPTRLLSRFVGYFTNNKSIWLKNFLIRQFIKYYQVDLGMAKRNCVEDYQTFNDFFTRNLKAGIRPIDQNPAHIISPVDGTVSQIGHLDQGRMIQAKGRTYTLSDLIIDKKLARIFEEGEFSTLYLSPKDYHRIHMPIDGKLTKMTYVPGRLFAVNPTSTKHISNLFARNERVICQFETSIGTMIIVLVGALFVGSIHTAWAGKITPNKLHEIQNIDYTQDDILLKKGAQLGHFELGSTVIMLFESQKIAWLSQKNTAIQFGKKMGNMI